jgi:thymidine kinase
MDNGYLHIIFGPMFSSKTTTLINEINILKIYKKNILVINSQKDIRVKDNYIQNHNQNKYKAIKCNELDYLLLNQVDIYDTVVIDEAQFFNNLVYFVEELLKMNKYIIVAGLNGDAQQKKFGYISDLIPICNKITKLSAICNICNDGTPGDFTKKKHNIISNEQIIIGGSDTFLAVCRKHLYI